MNISILISCSFILFPWFLHFFWSSASFSSIFFRSSFLSYPRMTLNFSSSISCTFLPSTHHRPWHISPPISFLLWLTLILLPCPSASFRPWLTLTWCSSWSGHPISWSRLKVLCVIFPSIFRLSRPLHGLFFSYFFPSCGLACISLWILFTKIIRKERKKQVCMCVCACGLRRWSKSHHLPPPHTHSTTTTTNLNPNHNQNYKPK